MSDEARLLELWSLVDHGQADAQQRVGAVALSGKLGRRDLASAVWKLVADEDSEVRRYVLLTLVFDLGVRTPEMSATCRSAALQDPDEDVRGTAVGCRGHLSFGSHDPAIFSHILAVLQNDSSLLVKHLAYSALFKVAGKPPAEWPGLREKSRSLKDWTIDWAKVAMLEDEVRVCHSNRERNGS